MGSANPPAIQIVVTWRNSSWLLLINGATHGEFASKDAALEAATPLVEQAHAAGVDCHVIIQERGGDWHDEDCPTSAPSPG